MLTAPQLETPPRLSAWQTWIQHPQKLWLRKAIFQVHLWTGLILGLYVLLMSVSGTILIYRVDISKASLHPPSITAGPGPRMTAGQLQQAVQRAHPNYQFVKLSDRKGPNQPVEISLEHSGKELQRLFNPYTGADLGDAVPASFRFIEWLTDLHDNLLYEPVGRVVNGIGGIATILLCFTGAVVWWPGAGKWRRALTVSWKADAKSFNWALHRAMGIWSIVFIFLWGLSGVYLAVPEPFETAVAFLDPAGGSGKKAPLAERALSWLARLHFGRFGGISTKLIWTLFGIAPIALVITGTWMWWNRVIRPNLVRKAHRSDSAQLARDNAQV
jgi:uncharacterized iron-regulated membrane protein